MEEGLRRQVLRSTAESVGSVLILHVKLAKTKVAQSDVTLVIEENVLGLEISVDHAEAVQTFQSTEKFGSWHNEGVVDLCQHGPFGECVGDFRPRDNVCLADCLEGVDSVRVLLAHLHDLTETALADQLEKFEILNLELACSSLDVVNTDLDLSGSVLHVNPLGTLVAVTRCEFGSRLLAILFAGLRVLDVLLSLFESGVDAYDTQKDILASTGSGWCRRVAHVQVDDELCHS
ncbi:hypothetical protein HG531_006704 [Fusarium graminearum]|nr:hypothetical protein HG531_006704 [Fusarium graminearum]